MTYFWRHGVSLMSWGTLWRIFDVMTNCFTSVLFSVNGCFIASLIVLMCVYAHACVCVGYKWISWFLNTLVIYVGNKIYSIIKIGLVVFFTFRKCHTHVQWKLRSSNRCMAGHWGHLGVSLAPQLCVLSDALVWSWNESYVRMGYRAAWAGDTEKYNGYAQYDLSKG